MDSSAYGRGHVGIGIDLPYGQHAGHTAIADGLAWLACWPTASRGRVDVGRGETSGRTSGQGDEKGGNIMIHTACGGGLTNRNETAH